MMSRAVVQVRVMRARHITPHLSRIEGTTSRQLKTSNSPGTVSLRERDEKLSCLRQEMLPMADSVYFEAKKLPLNPRMFEWGVGSCEARGRIVERLDEKGCRGGTLFHSRLVGLG